MSDWVNTPSAYGRVGQIRSTKSEIRQGIPGGQIQNTNDRMIKTVLTASVSACATSCTSYDLQIILESRRQGNSQELVGLMDAMENTRTSIVRLQQSREALRESLKALTKASAELDSYYTRQDTNTPRNPQPPIAPPRVYDSSARGGSSVEGMSAAELAER